MNSKQPSRYIKARMGNNLKEKILQENGIVSGSQSQKSPMILLCPRCSLVNSTDCKYCSRCTYPLIAEGYEEIKEQENSKFRFLEEKFNSLHSQVQSLITALSGLKDQNQLNQTARMLYSSGILKNRVT
jgi:hypothetical protein